ncbi:uncharacterized protein LTR77_003063 [Saxophila tyrrhenica]|uniref:Heterokaryon incompatibility domain-containing protein n=1 Tax=Saxophila tyrrhenica TaxID=1690608 RepID=A0AAV9PGD4_9PEZI|nr:hypothetical protein LTR77_003063 [Saxophila tyrrhenica]
MWLINTRTRQLEEFQSEREVKYAILSHTWGTDEVSFREMNTFSSVGNKRRYQKILVTCNQALQDGLSYAWLDSVCIDKSSSAELSEAVNSMWRWYEAAEECDVWLEDVPASQAEKQAVDAEEREHDLSCFVGASAKALFRKARWFTRGWTLQELLAPRRLQFYDQGWSWIGSRSMLSPLLHEITTIPLPLLEGGDSSCRIGDLLGEYSIAQRMSWASKRSTTRLEDRAYSLLGIFDVNMPLLYGEGSRAFMRLQEHIMMSSTDQSIFAWTANVDANSDQLLAQSPAGFEGCSDVHATSNWHPTETYEPTNRGIRISLPLSTASPGAQGRIS